jgi:hypothetical protein
VRTAICAYVDALGQQHGIGMPLRALARANGGPDVELNPGARLRRQEDAPCLLAIQPRDPQQGAGKQVGPLIGTDEDHRIVVVFQPIHNHRLNLHVVGETMTVECRHAFSVQRLHNGAQRA